MKPRNSAPINRKRAAALTKARMRNSTEWTGFLARITASAERISTVEKIQKNIASACIVVSLPALLPSPLRERGPGGEGSARERLCGATPHPALWATFPRKGGKGLNGLYLYGASIAILRAISRSQRSPLSSRRSLS